MQNETQGVFQNFPSFRRLNNTLLQNLSGVNAPINVNPVGGGGVRGRGGDLTNFKIF